MNSASVLLLALGLFTTLSPALAQPTRSQVVREQREMLRAGKFESLQKFAAAMSRQIDAMGEASPDSFYFCEAFQKPLSTKTGDLAWAAEKVNSSEVVLYHVWSTVGLGQHWPLDKYEANFEKGIKADLNFIPIYCSKLIYLLPRWHGEPGDVERFATEVADARGGEDGDILYMLLARRLAEWQGKEDFFDYAEISWPRMQRGFEARIKNPRNHVLELNLYCYYACLKKERATAKRLFEEIGSQWRSEAWGNQGVFEHWRKWAGP